MILLKFFKWPYYTEEDYRRRLTLICMQGVRKLPRKEKTLTNLLIFGKQESMQFS